MEKNSRFGEELKSKLYWGTFPLIILMIFNFAYTYYLGSETSNLKHKISKQIEVLLDIHSQALCVQNPVHNLSKLRDSSEKGELPSYGYCSFNRKDHFVIYFGKDNYIMAAAGGSIPFHIDDFHYWIVEQGRYKIVGKEILLDRKEIDEHKKLFLVDREDNWALYAYGTILMPRDHCSDLQKHLLQELAKL